MLGRKDYTQEEFNQANGAITQQLAAYEKLVKAIDATGPDSELSAALSSFEPLFFNHMTLALDRYFVHRVRPVTGKDGNPLNEVELVSESLINNDGLMRGSNAIKMNPAESVLKLDVGDPITLTAAQFERLATAFLADLRAKFLTS